MNPSSIHIYMSIYYSTMQPLLHLITHILLPSLLWEKKMTSSSSFIFLMCLINFLLFVFKTDAFDPTEGFDSLPLNESNFLVQRPYNVPQYKRYSFKNGVHKLWVFKNDKPHFPASRTNPRTEVRIQVSENK